MMKKSNFELWIRDCEINNTELWQLEGDGDTALYKTTKQYKYKYNFYYETPVFHVWIKGKCVTSTTNYQEAYSIYKNRIEELKNNGKT